MIKGECYTESWRDIVHLKQLIVVIMYVHVIILFYINVSNQINTSNVIPSNFLFYTGSVPALALLKWTYMYIFNRTLHAACMSALNCHVFENFTC